MTRRAPAEVPPPASGTGVDIPAHWVRGGFRQSEDEVLELVNDLTANGYGETLDFGRFMYRRQRRCVAGLTVFVDPSADNMPPVLVECPGEAFEFLGLDKLRVLFCNAELSRVDVAFDHTMFTPAEIADWARERNSRTGPREFASTPRSRAPSTRGTS